MVDAIRFFWKTRTEAAREQQNRGVSDQGNRASVTAGKNMDGFCEMVGRIIEDNGIPETEIHAKGRTQQNIPGFYRPTKNWDLLVVHGTRLLAAIEFKSQVGPSFGNNFNNRVEEAIGNAIDLNTAFREGAFGDSQKPFIGYFFVLEACPKSLSPVRFSSPHFATFPEFTNTSYAARYEILCRKLVLEGLYDSAALVLTKRDTAESGTWTNMSELTGAKRFASVLAGRIAGMS
ncbi:restriction endonuclease [bacterium]|nr:MAG: restriction endonuclease [bacterium]